MGRIISGNGYDGTSNAFRQAGEGALAVHHDPNDARRGDVGVKGNPARDGAPKRLHPVSVHNGMTERQRALAGMGHANASAPDASSANPLDPTTPRPPSFAGGPNYPRTGYNAPRGKQTAVPVHPSMSNKSRYNPDLGAAILAEATCDGDPNHPALYGRK